MYASYLELCLETMIDHKTLFNKRNFMYASYLELCLENVDSQVKGLYFILYILFIIRLLVCF